VVVINKIRQPGGVDIYDQIIKALEDNGDLDDATFRKFVLFALVDLGKGRRDSRICKESIAAVDKKVTKLEKYSILLLAHDHPKASIAVGFVVAAFVITVISRLELWIWIGQVIEGWLEVPLP
jgi:hypothetical protein